MRRPVSAAAVVCLLGGLVWTVGGGTAGAQESNAPTPIAQQLQGSKPATTLSPSSSAIDAVTDALLPHGVETPYEPLEKSLDDMLEEGWQLDQASGTHNNFTMLLSNGGRQALCVMVPRNLGQADTALVDCRQLN